ncbi:MAG: DNA gyrase subunit A [Flavobacteriaceae bacterium]|nr:DNA gyrase subunit A [Flavobacteriaceae bacterium]
MMEEEKNRWIFPSNFLCYSAQGGEGLSAAESTKVLPHNFNELIDASIKILKGQSVTILPDFMTGEQLTIKDYNDGKKGGAVRVRANIAQ